MVYEKVVKFQEQFDANDNEIINRGGCGVVADAYCKLSEKETGETPNVWLLQRVASTIPDFFDTHYDFYHLMTEIVPGVLSDSAGNYPITDFNICNISGKVLTEAITEDPDNFYAGYYIAKMPKSILDEILAEDNWNGRFVMSTYNKGKLHKAANKAFGFEVKVKYLEESELNIIDF